MWAILLANLNLITISKNLDFFLWLVTAVIVIKNLNYICFKLTIKLINFQGFLMDFNQVDNQWYHFYWIPYYFICLNYYNFSLKEYVLLCLFLVRILLNYYLIIKYFWNYIFIFNDKIYLIINLFKINMAP